jgi:ABC-type transport system substrate-binding protein
VDVAPPAPENQLSGLTVVDDKTFTIELSQADAEYPLQMAYTAFFPLPSVAYENTLGFNEAPIGNGPFMFDAANDVTWDHDTSINLIKNPNYAGDDQPSLDEVHFIITTDPKVDYIDTLDGNIDILGSIDVDFLAQAPTDFPDRFAQSPSTGILYMAFPSYLDDTFTKEHRQALNMAIDRELIIEKIFNNSGTAAHSVIPANLGGRDEVCANWNYDPEAAKALWDAAGPIEGGFPVWFNEGGGHEEWITAVVNMWDANLGLDSSEITFETRPWADYLPFLDDGLLTGPFRIGWGMDYPSPLNFLEPLYASYNTAPDGGSNASYYNNPDFDAQLAIGKDAVAASGSVTDGLPAYFAAEDILCDDATPVPIRFGLNQFVWNDTVDGVTMDAYGNVRFTGITSDSGIASADLTEPQSLFPMDANESEGTQVLMNTVYTGLIGFTSTGESFLGNAESMTSDDGGLTWTVVLKDGWTFHNGEAVTAQSYVDAWSFGARSALGFQNNSFYKNIAGYDELNAG